MKLSFRPRAGHLVAWPGTKFQGQPPRYVGRSFVKNEDDKAAKAAGELGVVKADKEPATIDSDNEDAPHLIRQCKKGGLLAADAETAAVCGVEFASLSQDTEGEWISTATTPVRSASIRQRGAFSESES